jgi:hypothetical protein
MLCDTARRRCVDAGSEYSEPEREQEQGRR